MRVIFLGIFYSVITVVAVTVLMAWFRSRRALRCEPAEKFQWHADFEELSSGERTCRHVLTGEFKTRTCPNGFDCRECVTHNRWTVKHPVAMSTGGEKEIAGMSYPLDRFYHRGHTWAHLEPDGTMTIGLDDLGRRMLGTPDSVKFPQPGAVIRTNGTAFHVRRGASEVRILAPVDGKVLETGGPAQGWYLRIRPETLDVRHLLRGAEVKPWVMREMDRLQLALSRQNGALAMADGGVPVENFAAACPEVDWASLSGEMFLEP